jgi:antitoxin VapB
MALSIKTEEADKLARDLATLTGETMTQAVTIALKERLERVRVARNAQGQLASRIMGFAESVRHHFDTRPVSKQEWDSLWEDEDGDDSEHQD